jgi:competence protein ComEA
LRLATIAALLWCALGLDSTAAFAQLPDGPGKDVTAQICGNCHGTDVIVGHRQGREEWIGTIQKMIASGAQGTEEQFTAILDYLTKNFGPAAPPININKATAAELETGLTLSGKEAAAIVKYRTDKGAYKTVDDLKKVPDLDFKKIEAQKDRLVF